MTAILSCRNLVKSFASEPPLIVLDHLSADFHENEICAITGMSGKGKSTLLAILGGTAKPDSGTVDFMGKQITSLPANELDSIHRCGIGFITQDPFLFQALTARENLLFTAKMQPNFSPSSVDIALEEFGLLDRADHLRDRELSLARSQLVIPALFLGGIASSSPTSRRTTRFPTGHSSFFSSNLSRTTRAMLSSP